MFRLWLTFFLVFSVALSALAELPPTCAGQNMSRYMHSGQPNDAPPDKIYRFTDLRASILQEIERPNPNRCVIDFYRSAVNEESNYWARAIQPGCTVNNRGQITGTCSRKSEAVRSTQFVANLDQELRGRLGARVEAAEDDEDDNTGEPNCPLAGRGPASAPQLTAQQQKDYFCCGDRNVNGNVNGQEPSREQQGMVRLTVLPWNYPVRHMLNYNECINKIRPRAVTAGTAATCVGSALQGAIKVIWDSISSIWKLPGVLWGLRTQIAALWRDRDPQTGQGGYRAKFVKGIRDAITHFVTDKVNAIGTCLNNPERINLVCRFAGEIISTLVLPESLGMLFGLATKSVGAAAGLITRGLSATSRGRAALGGLGRVANGAARLGRAGAAKVGSAARATGRVVDRATFGGAGKVVRGGRYVAGRTEALRQAVVVRPLARAGLAAVNRARAGASFASKFAAAARRERQFAEGAGAADAGLAGGRGPRPVTIDNATGRPVDPRSVPPDESLRVVRSSSTTNGGSPTGGAVRAAEGEGGAVVARAEPGAPSARGEPAARVEPARVEGPAPQARIEGPSPAARIETPTPVARIEGPAPQARLEGPAPVARLEGPAPAATTRLADTSSDVPTIPRLPAPPAQRLLPAPATTRVADAAADVRVAPRPANTSLAANATGDVRTTTTNIRATGSGTIDTRAPLSPTTVNVNYAQATPANVGPRLGGGSGGGGANAFTGSGGAAAESGLASRAGLGSGSTSKLNFVEGSTGAPRPAVTGRAGSASGNSVGGGARVAAVDEGGGAVAGRSSSSGGSSVARSEGSGSAGANASENLAERLTPRAEKAPARENGAPSNAESSAFAERPPTAKVSPEKVNTRLAQGDRQALDDLELPSLRGEGATFKKGSRFDDVESSKLKDKGPRVSEARETRIEVEDRLASLTPEVREQVFTHLKEIPATKAHVRDSDFAAILNSKNPTATIDRLKLASTGPNGRASALSKIDAEIGQRTMRLRDTTITSDAKLATASERSALLIERTLIEYGEDIRVRNIYSANTHNRFYDLQKGYEPHSLENTFNVDIEVVGSGIKVTRGSYATETAWSSPDGGYYTFYRKNGYLDRDISKDVLASPSDLTLPSAEQGISRFTSYEVKPGEQFSLGQNGPVRYDKKGQSITGSGGDGGSIELFCSRSPNCVKFENISDSVRTPTCRSGTPGCDQIFKIQEDSRFAAILDQPNPAEALAKQQAKTQKIIRDMAPEHDSLVAELARPDFDLIQARSKHPELVSAFNLEREISLKTNRLRGGGLGPRKLDSDTQALYDLEIGTNKTIQDIELSIPSGNKDSAFTNVQRVTKQEQASRGIAETISRADAPYRLREVDTKIRDTQARLNRVTDVVERRKIATDLIRFSEERSDILLAYKRVEAAVESKIKGIGYLDDSAKTALLDDALTRLKTTREPLAPYVARAEKIEPAVAPTSVAGARAPPVAPNAAAVAPKAPLRVLEDAPSFNNEIELLARRDGLSAQKATDPQIEAYARDLRITNGNMARDIDFKPIATKRDLDAAVAKALPDAGIDTDRLRRTMSYQPQSGYLTGADLAEARKFAKAVEARGVSTIDQLPLTKFERETLNKVIDRAPMYARQIDADVPKLGRLSTEAQVTTDVAGEAAAAAAKADFDARVARAEAALNKPTANVVPEKAPSYANEIEQLAQRDGLSGVSLNERQLAGYADDLRITNRNMAGAIEYKPVTTRRDMQSLISKVAPEGTKIDADRLRRMMSFRPQSGYLNGADFAEAKKFMQAVEARGGPAALDQLPLTAFERQNLNKIMDRAPLYARQGDPSLPAKMGRVNADPAAVVMPAKKAERFVADFEANGLNPKAATALTDADRIAVAERVTGRKLKPAESDAVIKAHNIDCGGFSVNNPCNANKGIALRRAGFNPEETRDIMRMGVTGSEGPNVSEFDKLVARSTPERRTVREPKPAAPLTVEEAGLRIERAEAAYKEMLANPSSSVPARLNARNAIETAQRDLADAQQLQGRALLDDLINKPPTEATRAARAEGSAPAVSERRIANDELRSQLSPARAEKMQKAFNESGTTPLNQAIETGDIRAGQTVTYTDDRGAVRTARLNGADPENPGNFLVETNGDTPKKLSLKQDDVAITPTEKRLMYKAETDRIQAKMDARTPEQAKADFDAVLRRTEENRKPQPVTEEARAAAQKANVDTLVDGVVKKAMANPNDAKIAELRTRASSEGIGTDKWRATMDEIESLERPYVALPKQTIDYYNRGLDEIPATRATLSDSELSFVGGVLERQKGKVRYTAEESALFAKAEKVLKYPAENARVRINEIARSASQKRVEIPRSVFDEVRKASPYDQQNLGKVEKLFKEPARDLDIGETSDLVFAAERFNETNFMKRKVAEGIEPYVGISNRIKLYGESKRLAGVIRKSDEMAATAAARYQASVNVTRKADDYMSDFRTNGLDEAAATALKDSERIAIAERVKRKSLTPAERDAVIKAHNIDCGGFSINNPCNANKGLTLRKAGFSQTETRELMQMGVTGKAKPVVVEGFSDFSLLRTAPKLTREEIGARFRKSWPNANPGARIQVDLPLAPYKGKGWVMDLTPAQTRKINSWAESVLATAQAKFPGKKLKIKTVDVGIGFNAGRSVIHADNGGTYLHASSTLEGGQSTIMFTDSARAKIDKAVEALGPQYVNNNNVYPYITSKGPQGNLTVVIREGSKDLKTIRLSKSDYIEPPAGSTAIFSGADHVNDVEGIRSALHSSPLRDPKGEKWDRVTFFVSIEPDKTADLARGMSLVDPLAEAKAFKTAPRLLTEAEKAAGKDKLIEEFGNVKLTTPDQNKAFIQLRETSTPDQLDRAFLVMDNTKLGEINNVTSNKLLANAITNKHIARVQESMAELAASYTKTKIKFVSASDDAKAVTMAPYSSFKSGAYGFVTEGGQKLPDEFLGLVSKRMVTLNQEYYTYLRELDVLPASIDPMFLFRSGLDRTYRDAEQAARQARTISDINRPRSMSEPQIMDQAERSFAMAQLAQEIHTKHLKDTHLVTLDAESGKYVFSPEGMDMIKKAKKPEVLMTQIKQTTGVTITETQAKLMIQHKADTDIFIPSTLVVTRESPVLDSIHGGINFDLVGAGAEGSFHSQLAVARSKNIDELFENSEKGEKAVTEILNSRRAAVRAATEPVMEKYGVKGRFVESGDDMAFVAENKPVPQAALDEVVRNLGKTKEPSKVRMSAVEGGIDSIETRMTIGTQGEAIEKSVRARLIGVLPKELQDKLVIAVKMETKEIGSGTARLMIGSDAPITPFQRQQIERAFTQAAAEYKYNAQVTSNLPAVIEPRTGTALIKSGSREVVPVNPKQPSVPAVIENRSSQALQTTGGDSRALVPVRANEGASSVPAAPKAPGQPGVARSVGSYTALAVGSQRDRAPDAVPRGPSSVENLRPLSAATALDQQLTSGNIVRTDSVSETGAREGKVLKFENGTRGIWKPDTNGGSASYRSELLAYEIDKRVGFNLAAPTVLRTVDGQKGAVKLFNPDSQTPRTGPARDKQSAFDFLTDNGDLRGEGHATEIKRFLSTPEGQSMVERLRGLSRDPQFRGQVTDYLGSAETQKLMNRLYYLIDTADQARAPAASP